jgi:osmotically-inducible protein OsmY
MAEPKAPVERHPLDIEHDIHELIHTYAPLRHDRHRVHITVNDGHVVLSGYIKAIPTYEYLVNNVPLIDGVKSVDSTNLHEDETIRREVGQVVPAGIQVNIEYGAVILSGSLPQGVTIEELAQKVGMVPGVHRVISSMLGENV